VRATDRVEPICDRVRVLVVDPRNDHEIDREGDPDPSPEAMADAAGADTRRSLHRREGTRLGPSFEM
jgi:hypothetical protein